MIRYGQGLGALMVLAVGLAAQTSTEPRSPLDDFVGRWRSDTVAGNSIAYHCEPSPIGEGLICHETLTSPGRVERWIGVYLPDSTSGEYRYYQLAGRKTPAPERLMIRDQVWTFGGDRKGSDGIYHRTTHDFRANNGTFTWRKESSPDGLRWTKDREGVAHRMRPLVTPDER